MAGEQSDVIFVGNPGVGKSTLLNSVSGVQFNSGFNWGDGLNIRINFKTSPAFPGVRFGDTPGLADIEMAERAAEAITAALKDGARQGRRTMIFFIVTVQAGRVKPDDLFTIKQVMGSIIFPNGERPSKNDYGVIINKCTFLNRPDFSTTGRQRFQNIFGTTSGTVPYTTNHLYFVPHVSSMVDARNSTHEFTGLREWVMQYSGMNISTVETIDVSRLEEQLRAAADLHRKEMEKLEAEIRRQQEEEKIRLQNEMERERIALQQQIASAQAAQRRYSSDSDGCVVM